MVLLAELLDLLALLAAGQIRPQATVGLSLPDALAQHLVTDTEIARDRCDRPARLERETDTTLDQLLWILPGSGHELAVPCSRTESSFQSLRETQGSSLWSRNGFTMPFYANARDWGTKARALGYAVGGNPTPGSVAWSSGGDHVAYMQEVSGSTIRIEEYNHDLHGYYSTRVLPAACFTAYIHFKDLSADTQPQPTPNRAIDADPDPDADPDANSDAAAELV